MHATTYLSISSQKGGVGKTTVTVLVASAFHFLANQKVAVIDCDYPQHSLEGMRQQELEQLDTNAQRAADFQALDRPAYPVIACEVKDALAIAQQLQGQFDLVFIDTPGTINVPGIMELWKQLDYIFIPVEADKLSISATLTYASVLQQFIMGQPDSNLQQFYAFWNKHIKSERQDFYQRTEELFVQQEIPFLQSRLEHSVNYKKEGMRSTIFPLSKEYMRLGISSLLEEMARIIFPESVLVPAATGAGSTATETL